MWALHRWATLWTRWLINRIQLMPRMELNIITRMLIAAVWRGHRCKEGTSLEILTKAINSLLRTTVSLTTLVEPLLDHLRRGPTEMNKPLPKLSSTISTHLHQPLKTWYSQVKHTGLQSITHKCTSTLKMEGPKPSKITWCSKIWHKATQWTNSVNPMVWMIRLGKLVIVKVTLWIWATIIMIRRTQTFSWLRTTHNISINTV